MIKSKSADITISCTSCRQNPKIGAAKDAEPIAAMYECLTGGTSRHGGGKLMTAPDAELIVPING